jgi:hypothetical protein
MKIRYDDEGNIVEWGENPQGSSIIDNVDADLLQYISICGKVVAGKLVIDEKALAKSKLTNSRT